MKNLKKILNSVLVVFLISTQFNVLFAQENIPPKQINLGSEIKSFATQEKNYVEGEILVKFKSTKINLKSAGGNNLLNTFEINNDLQSESTIKSDNIALMKIDSNQNVEQKLIELQSDPNVEYAQPNFIYHIMSDDPLSGQLWGLPKIKWNEAMSLFSGTSNLVTGTIVAVIDMGVSYNHPDLINKMRNGSACKDDAGASLNNCQYGYDFRDDDKDPYPLFNDHGTHVAGTIGAQMDNGIGIMGVNPQAKIMTIRAGENGNLSSYTVMRGINFAKYNGARVINASFGSTGYDTGTYNAIASFPGLFIAAAGNAGTNNDTTSIYPCNYTLDNIICVASTDSFDALSSFSNYGSGAVDLGAPGGAIYSTIYSTAISLQDDFTSSATGEVPNGRTTGGTANNRGVLYVGGGLGKVLFADIDASYANNANSFIETGKDLSSYIGASLLFETICDTEYVSSDADYMSLEISADGVSYTGLNVFLPYTVNDNKWSEWTLDNNSDPNDNTTLSGTYAELYSSIPTSYLTNNFKIRFKWTTNGSDNNYNGCLVDNIKIEGHNPSYGYKDGTSMATPHVAGLASLAWSSSPSLTYAQIRNIIINSGDALASLSGKTVSGKRINAQNVLQALGYSSNSGANWSQIYTAMGATLSGQGIQNNLNNVTNNTVNNFLGLYFAKMSGSSELGRIIFATGLNLTDTGTQNFLSGDLPTSIGMSQGQIWFNPGTGFIGKNATLKMNLPYNFSSILGSINSGSFIVRDGSGGAVTGNSMITSVYSGTCVGMGDYACPLYIDVAHFTQFDLKPLLTNVVISSNNSNTSYAKSGHIVTLSFTGSETLTGISISINGSGYSYTGNGIYFTSTFTVTGGTAETGIIFSINYQDLNGNTGNTVTTTTNSSSVKVDNTPPSITVTSANTTSSATITLQGTGSDINGISQIYVSGSLATGTGSWSKTSVGLVGGSNTINLSGIDLAGNITTTTFNITRLPVVSSVISQVLSGTSAIVSFNSDFISSGYIIYGTSTLNNIFTGTLSASHSMALNGLTHNTTYYYRAYAKINGSTGDVSATGSFILPYVIPTTGTSNITTTGTADLGGGASTSFTNSGMLRLYTSGATSTGNYFEISLNGLGVLSDSGAWNGLINGPIQTSFIGTAPSYTDYTHQSGLTFKIGVDNIAITFSGKQATVKILVGTTYDGKSLRVYRSSNGTTYSRIDNCTVSAGYCTFSTDTFSYFTMMSPSVAGGGGGGGGGGGNTTVDVPTCKLSDVICIDGYYEIDGNVDCEGGYLGDACYDDTVNNNNTDEGDISNSPFNTELNDAYQYAYQIGITTMSTIQKANMTGTLQRSHLAKMIVNYATEVLSKQADTTKSCNFSDISDQSTELKGYIKTACQMGLMGVGLKTFYPKNKVTRAEFGTILSRALRGNGSDQSGGNYYVKHLQALKYAGVMTQISIPSIIEIRGYVMLMLMRAKDKQ